MSILILSTLVGIGCWDFGYEENKYVTPFDENVLVAPDLMPFLFSNHQYHWGRKDIESSIASNSDRWAIHFHQKYSVKEIDQICYEFSQAEFESAIELSHPDTFNNALITDFRHGKHAFELKYLRLAHQASSVSTYPDVWEVIWNERFPSYVVEVPSGVAFSDTMTYMVHDSSEVATPANVIEQTTNNNTYEIDEQNSLAREKFIEDSLKLAFKEAQLRLMVQFQKLQKETSNADLLERIFFQQIKLAFYLQWDEAKIESLFHRAYPSPKPNSIFYWDALEHLAGSRENEQQKALEFAQIFDAVPRFRKGAIAGFPELSDETWDQTLHCASTPQQKATLWAMLAYQQPEITAYAFEQIYDIYPTSTYADLLLVRQIQLLEFGIHAHEISVGTYPYSGAVEYQFIGEEFKNQITDFAYRIHERFRKNKSNLTETQRLCWAYLQHLAGNEESALKILQHFNPTSKEIARQALVFKILAQQKINYRKPWSPELDRQTVQDLKQLSNFPNFKNICQKTPINIWENDTISDETTTFDNKEFESIEDFGYASLRDGFRIYLLHYMEKIQGEESYQNQEPITNRNASQTLAQWFLDSRFKIYDYPEIWGAAEVVQLLDSSDRQSLTDRWFLHHFPQEVAFSYQDKNYNIIDYNIPINRDFWCEIAGELALQKHEFSDAEKYLTSIIHPEKYPRLQLENNPTTFGAQNLDSLMMREFGSKPITNKAELAQILNHLTYFVQREEENPKKVAEKKAIAHWILAHLFFNISYDGNCWNASRFAWSSSDPEYFSDENQDQCLLSVVPDNHYFDLSPVKEHLQQALQYFNDHPKQKELLAGLLITKIQFDYFNFYSPLYTNWHYTIDEANNGFNQSSGMDLQRLKSNLKKTKTYQQFIQHCPEFEYYATN